MLQFLVQRPVAVLMSFLGAITLGLIVWQQLPISLLPNVPIPRISVQVAYPNTGPEEMERAITEPLRNQLLQLSNLKQLNSESRSDKALLELIFDFNTNTELAFIEANEKIDQAMRRLPRDIERPRVIKANVADIPVMELSVIPGRLKELSGQARAQYLLEFSDFCKRILKRRIEQLDEIAFVDLSGWSAPQIKLLPKPKVMQSLGLNEQRLADIIKENNTDLGSIIVKDGHYQFNLSVTSSLDSKDDIEQLYFTHEGKLFQIKDIARVELITAPARGRHLLDEQPAVLFTLRKQSNARLFDLKKNFETLLASFREDYPELDFVVNNDQTKLLQVSIDNLVSSLYYGAFFAFIVLFLFFREWQAPVLIAIAVPLALIIALLGFYLLDLSINTISLSGLILGVGLMIDNSIIVIENIRQQRRLGYPLTEACYRGGNEVIRPLLSSALTTCAVFFPLIFISGLAGALFYDQAISISIALAASLIVAFILLPTLSRLVERKKKIEGVSEEIWIQRSADSWFARSVNPVIRYPWLSIGLFLGIMGIGYYIQQFLPREVFPKISREGNVATINWNEPIQLEENELRVNQLLDYLEGQYDRSSSLVGELQFLLASDEQDLNEAKVLLFTTDEAQRLQLKQAAEQWLARNYPVAQFKVLPIKNLFDEIFTGPNPQLIMHVRSVQTASVPSLKELTGLLSWLEEQQIIHTTATRQVKFDIRILKSQALLYDIPINSIYIKLRTLFNEYNIGELNTSADLIPIIIGNPQMDFRALIDNTLLSNRKGDKVPLGEMVHIVQEEAFKVIHANASGAAFDIVFPDADEELLQRLKDKLRSEPGLDGRFSGQLFTDQESIYELLVILLVSIILLYLILAAQFESLLQPFIVMLAVPVGLSGAIAVLSISGESLNLIAIIGMIVMSGIVVNDAILKVDMMNKLYGKYRLAEAIHGAGQRRLRPILMTSLTTILALLPIIFSAGLGAELQRPLAFAVIGGLCMGTIASLYFIPALYITLVGRRKEKNHQRSAI